MNAIKGRKFVLWLLLGCLAVCTALAEDEEILFSQPEPVPRLIVTSPSADESYAAGGTVTVTAQGVSTGSIDAILTASDGQQWRQSQEGGQYSFTFQLPEKFSQSLTLSVVGYSQSGCTGTATQVMMQIPSPKEEFIDRMIALAEKNSKEKRYRFAPAESDTDIGVCKNFVMRLFDTFAGEYRMAEFPEMEMFMPKNNTKANCAPYDYGIEWAPATADEGCPFEIVYEFKYDRELSKEENAALAFEMMEQVQRGDFFQMVGYYGGGNGPHSLFFIQDYDPQTTMLYWTDSNMKGQRIDGVRWGYLQYNADAPAEWFVDCFNTKNRGATLYRLRDDLYKYQ